MFNLNGNPLSPRSIHKIAILGNHTPRQCGIATFTTDLADTLSHLRSDLTIDVVAMSDRTGYDYPPRVRYEIPETDLAAYDRAADYINRHGYEVLSIQHEYGIFGGEAGKHLLNVARATNIPIVTTLHTVLREPSPAQRAVMDELLQISERVVVMSRKAVGFLADVHGTSPDKIDVIPHGVPDIPEYKGREFRETLEIDGSMILTFGLLSPDKGIQYVIEAMPKIVREFPGATYVVVGATHPNVRSGAGESYRQSLHTLAESLGVSENVRFVDRFVEREELIEYLSAMDIYVTPYLNPKQITSGTLAYSVGAGKAVISTPYTYAQELLADGRGVLVPFKSAEAIADAVIAMERDPEARNAMGHKAAEYGKQMLWPEVGKRYLASFARARDDSGESLRKLVERTNRFVGTQDALPELRLGHLLDLSDDTGILQHATYTVPNRSEGYCVDDNARALLLTARLEGIKPLSPELSLVQSRYLSFVMDSYNPLTGRFRNFMSYGRVWLEDSGSEDSHGRTVWALGALASRCGDVGRREVGRALFERGSAALYPTTSPRTWAYGVLGAHEFLNTDPRNYGATMLLETMANRLWRLFETNHAADWPWFEQSLSYGNARLSQAMLLGGELLGNGDMVEAGLESLTWLMNLQTGVDSVFYPVGSQGFYKRGGECARYDQQPIEAVSAVSACLDAERLTGDPKWLDEAERAFGWFLGANALRQSLYDETTGGCHDGLHKDRVNRNQGTESTLSFLSALIEMRQSAAFATRAASNGKYEVR